MKRRLTDHVPPRPLFQRRMVQIWCAAFLAAAALLLLINYHVQTSLRQQIVAREEAQLRQIVDVTGAAIDHLFTTANKTLESIRKHVKTQTSPLAAHELLQTAAEAGPFIRALAIVDLDGTYLHSSRAFPAPEMNLKNSPMVAHFREKALLSDPYYLSPPMRNSIDGEWQVVIGIPQAGPDGAASELFAAVMDIKNIYSELMFPNQGEGGEMTLVDSKFRLVASSPWQDEKVGSSLADTPAYRSLLEQTRRETSGIVTSQDTGQQTISASRWLKDGRLSLAATRPLDIVLHDWRVLSNVVLAVSLAIMALMGLTALLSIRDALERQRQSDALRLSQQRFRLLVDGATDHAIYMLDTEGKISNWNHGAERIKGYKAEQVKGRSFDMFFTAEDRRNAAPAQALAEAMTGVYRSEGLRLRQDGSEFWANVVMAAVFDADGQHIGFSNITRDVSEQQTIRQQLKRTMEEAERAGAAKADFLANMSHEIRTPLNGIIGYADLALEDPALSPKTRRHIGRVFDASKLLHVIIDDILDFSKIEARGVELQPLPFEIAVLADTCISVMQSKATEGSLKLDLRIDADVPQTLLGDGPRLRQVLLNLLNNAVKFTERGSVTLAVKCLSLSPAHARLSFSVTDTGIGIAAEDQDRLFQRFSQADSSISRRFGGTGLGLAISKHIVTAMNGELTVVSAPGQGSTFSFAVDLPLGTAASMTLAALPVAASVKPLRILSVDDVEMNRDLCSAILSRAGHQVSVAASGAAAVDLLASQEFDIVLMDIQMPDMDGLEATRRIRALPDGKGALPIVALTANVLADQVSRYKAAGMDGHIGKPIVKAELLAGVIKWTSERPVAAAEPAPAEPAIAARRPASVHDQEALDELRSFISGAMVTAMVGALHTAIAKVPVADLAISADHQELGDAAHKAIAVAGQLGFVELAESFRTLEAACRLGQPESATLADVHDAAERARAALETLSATSAA